MIRTRWVVAALVLMAGVALAQEADLRPVRLRCEWLSNPLGVDVPAPRLSWILQSSARGQVQGAYRILVASSPAMLAEDRGDLWDSGKVASAQSIHISYAGKPLTPTQEVFWKVRAWDGNGRPGPWSETAQWTMGLLQAGDWPKQWITAPVRTMAEGGGIGYHAAEAATEAETKWVQVDLGRSAAIEAVRLHPVTHSVNNQPIAGFGFPVRFRVDASDDPAFANCTTLADHTSADDANPGARAVTFDARAVSARYVRVTAVRLWNRRTGPRPFCFALAELEVVSSGKNIARGAAATALDSVESWGWGKAFLTDGRGLAGAPAEEAPSALIFRREFTVDKPVRRAIAYVCGLGHFELRMNGKKVGDHELDPGWTNYRKTCLYVAHDVTESIRRGPNAMGVMLGNGMYNVVGGRYVKFTGTFGPPKVILQLHVEYADGTTARIGTDSSWQAAASPITFSCVYGGEDYDARREPAGWDAPGYAADGRWKAAVPCDGPGGSLRAQMYPPIRVMRTISPAGAARALEGGCLFDLGQNFSGWPRITVRGAAGARVRLIPAELLRGDRANQSDSGGPVYFTYTLKGAGAETWRPRFSYYGFRYVQVEGAVAAGMANPNNLPVIESMVGEVLYPDVPRSGEFECSNELFNRIHTLIDWATVSNLKSVLTDCPHREKLGWLEVVHLMGPSLLYDHDAATLYAKYANDMAEAQLENGLVPDIAPEYTVFSGGFRDSPEWGSAFVIAPWEIYQYYGDTRLFQTHYERMKRYADYLESKSKDHIVSHGLGDWYDIGPKPVGVSQNTPLGLTATAIYYHDVALLAEMAQRLGKTEEAGRLRARAGEIRAAFNKAFFNPQTKQYATGSQTSNAMALVLGLVEPADAPAVVENLIRDIRRRGNHTSAGDVGYRFVLRALAAAGRSDVICDMASQREDPSYGFQLAQGATSLTEAWDGPTRGHSQNHMMLGHLQEWFYRELAGISVDLSRSGDQRIVFRPQVVGDVTWARARYASALGPISAQWRREGNRFSLDVSLPANTSAEVFIPGTEGEVSESGRPARESAGVKYLRTEAGARVYRIGSGDYHFGSTLPR